MREGHDDLRSELSGLGEQLDTGRPAHHPVAVAIDRIRASTSAGEPDPGWRPPPGDAGPVGNRSRRPLVLAASAVVVALAATLAAPGPRAAVARWLGIGSVDVTYTDEVPFAAGRTFDLGTPVPLPEALDEATWPVQSPANVDAPARAYTGQPGGSITLVWAPSPDLPEIDDSGIGLLLAALPGTIDGGNVSKEIGPRTSVEQVPLGDGPAYWIAGEPHLVRVTDADGRVVVDATRLAGNTLVWTDGDITYRLESALTRDDAVALASDLQRLRM